MKKTKIIATIGPATDNVESFIALYKAGVNIIRFNFSHANYNETQINIDTIKKLNSEGRTSLSLLLDTKGPEIRTGDLDGINTYKLGAIFKIYVDDSISLTDNSLFCDYTSLIQDVELGKKIVIDSGLLSVKVIEKNINYLLVEALNDASIGSRRHVNLPGVKLRLPGITEKDVNDIKFAIENDFAFIAASFIRNASNIKEIRDLFKNNNCKTIKLISKIENQEAIDNLDEIIQGSDGVMVARGDLGIEVPIQKLAIYQKEIVKKCNKSGKFVITATHLLETMIDNPFPTRAESSDVFNSVIQKADCLMLSGETAIGKFPIESVEMMTSIIQEAESVVNYKFRDYSNDNLSSRDIEKKLLIRSSLFIGKELGVKTLIILTKTGLLARLSSAFRPSFPICSFTPYESSIRNTDILFGINPIQLLNWNKENYNDNLENAIKYLKENGIIYLGDKIIAINDIQKEGHEIPIMEIIEIN